MNFLRSPLCYLIFISGWLLVEPATARTQSEKLDLTIRWSVPEECGSTEDVYRQIEDILGKTISDLKFKKVVGNISALQSGWVVTMFVYDEDRKYERTVEVNTCTGALELSALLTALAVDPIGVLRSENPVIQAELEKLNNPTATNNNDPAPTSSSSTPHPETVAVKAIPHLQPSKLGKSKLLVNKPSKQMGQQKPSPMAALVYTGPALYVDMGMTSAFRPGFFWFGAVNKRWLLLEVSVQYSPPSTYSVQNNNGVVDWTSHVFSMSVGIGQLFSVKRIHVGWTLDTLGIGIGAESNNVTDPQKNSTWFGATGINGRFLWELAGNGGLYVRPGVQILWSKPKFSVEGIGIVHQPSRLVGVTAIGIFWVLGKRKSKG